MMTKKAKKETQHSAIQRTFGALKNTLPALTPKEERKAAEEDITGEAIKRMSG
jgi:hypothetical protein